MDDESKIFGLKHKFVEIFGGKAEVYRAPDSVTLIGDDLAEGFLVTVPVDSYFLSAIRVRNDSEINLRSTSFDNNERDVDYADLNRDQCVERIRRVVLALRDAGHQVSGLDILVADDFPIKRSRGVPAAVEVLAAFALLDQFGFSTESLDPAELVRCPGMTSNLGAWNGRKGKAIELDSRSFEFELIGMPEDVSVVICDTMSGRGTDEGKSDARRADLKEAASILTRRGPEISSIRDVTMAELELRRSELSEKVFWFCRHVISENERVRKFASALSFGDLTALGNLMYESHRSLREDFEISSPELNLMVQIASMQEGTIGARLTGGSFEGCTVNLVRSDSTTQFISEVSQKYKALIGIQPEVYECSVVGGVECIENKMLALHD